ncbi:leucyl-tRNA synthetase [Venturia nashicola]|uniref:leucine--tRNA ligase n=1 Tax=Venturia nashicola TaxID=86259 RepID=A0A4Z1PFA5_9PEZI|nr:leucyl-tRNA synthetase [Venturia nashicola]
MSTSKAPVVTPEAAQGTLKIENTEKRDTLREIEVKYEKLWADAKVFEADAPTITEYPPGSAEAKDLHTKIPKFFGTMAYPYVNGTPHLGHAFSVTKIEYAARVARAQGKRVLWPMGFHCTGMPIKACADKLVNEVKLFGQDFDGYKEEVVDENEPPVPAPTTAQTKSDVTKFSNVKKGKAALKTTKAKYQFQVMLSLGIPKEEIHKFADSAYWLTYFPQLWQQHLSEFGCGVDWRRSFVTTNANPYYDSFVRWQMRKLKGLNKIQFGKRYTVYSPKDQQACLDHDRASGEGVNVQEYTAVKCKVKQWSEAAQKALEGKLPENANVFMVPATLRPETMYGQSNIFVAPKINYGIFQVSDKDFYFITERGARNMSFQNIFPKWGVFPKIASLVGADVIGTLVTAPLSVYKDIYVVPMDTIKEGKGTGVVTSVPSDSPDDYIMNRDLVKKPDFYGIKAEWVPTDILPIIETPNYGQLTAKTLVEKMKISSPKDAKQLAEAKDEAYKEGFYKGKMIHGEFTGKTVPEAKELCRQLMIKSGEAFAYGEPDGEVISRTGETCVAAHLDQWFLTYGDGDEAWRNDTLAHVKGEDGQDFNTFTEETKHSLVRTLGWMQQWAVTRQFGLGTKLPWDESQLVEGLSDSTIYMAYYTVAHYLHADIYGEKPGKANIKPEQMTDEVWDYVFATNEVVPEGIAKDTLEAMRREFTYWYPLDVRISGKDLINNHLVFFLYIHQAVWGKVAPQYLPKGIRINGHAMLNGDKMSKSTGNFLTLDNAVSKFGADATRVALADAGDGVEDANFEETVANATILKLFELKKWIEEVILEARVLKADEKFETVRDAEKIRNTDIIQRTGETVIWDNLFINEMSTLAQEAVQHYGATSYKSALKAAFFDFTSARDSYRISTSSTAIGMHHDTVRQYVELQSQLLAVITPHWSDYIWQEILKKPSTIQNIPFPKVPDPTPALTATTTYVRQTSSNIGAAEGIINKKLAKGKANTVTYDPKAPKRLTIFVTKSFPEWQEKYIDEARNAMEGLTFDDKKVRAKIAKPDMKRAMPFVQLLKKRLDAGETASNVFDRKLPFDEVNVLQEMVPGLKVTVPKLKEVDIVVVEEVGEKELPPQAASAEPGQPTFAFGNV